MTTQFPPSTFPTMSLGAPANVATSSNNNNAATPPPADPSSVMNAIQHCSSHDASLRRPAEEQLQQWENAYTDMHATGYLTSLLSIINSGNDTTTTTTTTTDSTDPTIQNARLLAAILLKNGIPKSFSVQLLPTIESPANNEGSSCNNAIVVDPNTTLLHQLLQQERGHVRSQLPLLLFREGNDTIALHLQLALANIALFDFPMAWPTLLEDLVSVANGQAGLAADMMPPPNRAAGGSIGNGSGNGNVVLSPEQIVRIRAVKTLRLCLQSIRQRKIVVQKGSKRGGGAGGHPMLNMRNLGAIINKAAEERKEMHGRACMVLPALAEGVVTHAQAAVGGGGDASSPPSSFWHAESLLAVGYVKCMTELMGMVEIDNLSADPRTPVVRSFLESLAQICNAVKVYPATAIPPSLAGIPSIQQEYTMKMDKLYRASLICCIASIRSLAQLFAPQVSHILPSVVEPIMTLDTSVLQSMPVKRLMNMTGLIQVVLLSGLYDEKRKDSLMGGKKNAVLAALMGSGGKAGGSGDDERNDPGVIEARNTVTALLAGGTIERLIEALVGKFLRLHAEELQEWEDDPEGRYETDLAEKSLFEADSPRHCGGALLLTLMTRETDRVAASLLELTQRVYQQLPPDDVNGMLNREACYRSLELCHKAMVGPTGEGRRRLNFLEWYQAELQPILQTELGEGVPVAMRAMQARAIQVVQAYSTSLNPDEFAVAFQSITRLIAARDLVTCFCAARCINHLALLHIKGEEESPQLLRVREHSVLALGNAFSLANRSESEECLRVTLMTVSALVEANGLYLEPVLHAIAEQLPKLWERAKDSVPIHSCLLSVLNHLIMKMGHSTIENPQLQQVLFPLLDYCTDITVVNRAETLLEDGLRLWLVTLVSSRVATMGPNLMNMLPRLHVIITSGLEPHLSLKVLQFYAVLLGQQVIGPLTSVLPEMLVNLTKCIYSEQKEGDGGAMDDGDASGGKDRGVTTIRNAIAALSFAEAVTQFFPDVGASISSPAIKKIVAALPGKALSPPVLEAIFSCLGRLIFFNPKVLDEIFADDPNKEANIAGLVRTYITVVSSVSVIVMLSVRAQKVTFIKQKACSLNLCLALTHSPLIACVAGKEIIEFTRKLQEIESKTELSLDSLVEAACGMTRKVVGDGPMGDIQARSAEISKSDPLLTVRLTVALNNAEQAMARLPAV